MRNFVLILTVAVGFIAMMSSVEAANGAGCKGGYCWAYCSPFEDLYDWCYTTGGDNTDGQGYARCSGEGGGEGQYIMGGRVQCSSHWTCNGPCSL